jgi:aryl carrier-like protein
VAQALALLERAIQRQHIQVSALRVDWSRWRGAGLSGRVSLRFAHLCRPAEAGNGQVPRGTWPGRDAILAAAPGRSRELVESLLRDKVARVLGTVPDRLDGDSPLLYLGLDSLMAVELRNWIEGELAVNLPIVELMRSPSMSCLIDLLLERISHGAEAAAPEAGGNGVPKAQINGRGPAPLAAAPEELLDHVEELSGEQVDALLASLLNEQNDGVCREPSA